MVIACWSVKGGSGTSVVAASLALILAERSQPPGALLVDLAGDSAAVLGLAEPVTGVREWLAAGDTAPADSLARLEVDAAPNLRLLPAGLLAPPTTAARGEVLAALLGDDPRPIVIDAGVLSGEVALTVAASATVSLLVVRPCYLALRRAVSAPLRPSGVVLVGEVGRALGRADVEAVLGVPVRAEVMIDPAVARAVDAGVLASRLPKPLARALRHAA
jgi:MinD-like ATPase involved in chromosome partitioning or flagellar assembly